MMDIILHDLSLLNHSQKRSSLADRTGIHGIEYFEEIDSTQNRIRNLAEETAPDWTVVVADHQTSGRGQHGRSWISSPGRSLMFSLLLHPSSHETMALIPIRTGLAIVRSLLRAGVAQTAVGLKWPNDILLHGNKIGGILCEGVIRGDAGYSIIGVGINVHSFEISLPDTATTGPGWLNSVIEVNRYQLLEGVLQELRAGLASPAQLLDDTELRSYAEHDWLQGRDIIAPVVGKALGINAHGHLQIRTSQNAIESILAGTIRLQ